MHNHVAYTREELAHAVRAAYGELIDFVTTPEFRHAMGDLKRLRNHERPQFVLSVFLNKEELAKRGIKTPDGILIQRSAFGDRRPTLFCVKKYLPAKYSGAWENVNITFDNEFADESVSRAPEFTMRPPLPVTYQAEMMATGRDLEKA